MKAKFYWVTTILLISALPSFANTSKLFSGNYETVFYVQEVVLPTTCTVEVKIGFLGLGGKVTATAETCEKAWQMIKDLLKKDNKK
jgi:hypothetical protein